MDYLGNILYLCTLPRNCLNSTLIYILFSLPINTVPIKKIWLPNKFSLSPNSFLNQNIIRFYYNYHLKNVCKSTNKSIDKLSFEYEVNMKCPALSVEFKKLF